MKTSRILEVVLVCAMLLGFATMVSAYTTGPFIGTLVKATTSNTTSLVSPYYNTSWSDPNTWYYPYYELWVGGMLDGKNAPLITTTISLNPAKIYQIRVVYGTERGTNSSHQYIYAALHGDALIGFSNTGYLANDVTIGGPAYYCWEGYLGAVQGVSSVSIDVDDRIETNQETMYWGVSYLETGDVPVPEPSALLALGSGIAGLLGFAVRRRRM